MIKPIEDRFIDVNEVQHLIGFKRAHVYGALSAYGNDESIAGGAGIGAATGAVAPAVVSGVSALGRRAGDIIGGVIGTGTEGRAQRYMQELLTRSGRSADDIADDLARAQNDGQGVYTVADALGTPGQKALSGVARTPGQAVQEIVETMESRQAGQGRRIANALSEGFDASDTATQRIGKLETARELEAARNYGSARGAAGAVDPSAAIQAADDFLTPGASGLLNPGTNIAEDSVEGAVRRARSYLTDGSSVLTDYNAAFRAKREIDAMIEAGSPTIKRQLIPIRNSLDEALAASSQPYATARDAFRQASNTIEAVDIGTQTARNGRVEDTIPAFNAMAPEEQAAFRVGYADPQIAKTQGAAYGVNKARDFTSDAAKAEIPAFAAPGKAQQLEDRIARENTMFATRNRVVGGSRTADNMGDISDVGSIDPSLLTDIITGRWGSAASGLVRSGVNAVTGRNEATRNQLAKNLLTNDPNAARDMFLQAIMRNSQTLQNQDAASRALGSSLVNTIMNSR